MEFYEFVVVGLMLCSGSYSSAIMAGIHPVKGPNLKPEDLEELKEGNADRTFYLLGTIVCPICYAIVFFWAFAGLNFLIVLLTAFILHPILTMVTRLFLSDNEISEWVTLMIVIGLPLAGLLKLFPII